MSLNQTMKSLIGRLPTLTTEERWVVQAVLDLADQRALPPSDEPLPDAVPAPPAASARERLRAAPYFITARELQVLDLLLSGLSNKEAARQLGISFKTVQAHRQRIMDKLGARSPMHLAEIMRRLTFS